MKMSEGRYFPALISENEAKAIATMLYESAYAVWEEMENPPDDYEFWYGIAENWDINIFAYGDGVLKASIYKVTNGETDYNNFITLDVIDIHE